MKKIIYICICFIFSTVLFISCMKDFNDMQYNESAKSILSISEAQAFFEDRISENATRGSSGVASGESRGVVPGEFTPQWYKSKTVQNYSKVSVDVPIIPEFFYSATRYEFNNGKKENYNVEVTQKLVVVKCKEGLTTSQYLLTLITDRDYYAENKGNISNKFLHSGDKGTFSGIALYSYVESGLAVNLEKYKDGKKVSSIFIPKGYGTINDRIRKANKLVGRIKIHKATSANSRSLGEEDPPSEDCTCGGTCSKCNPPTHPEGCTCSECSQNPPTNPGDSSGSGDKPPVEGGLVPEVEIESGSGGSSGGSSIGGSGGAGNVGGGGYPIPPITCKCGDYWECGYAPCDCGDCTECGYKICTCGICSDCKYGAPESPEEEAWDRPDLPKIKTQLDKI